MRDTVTIFLQTGLSRACLPSRHSQRARPKAKGGGGAGGRGRADQSLAVAVGGGRFKAYVNILESMRVCVCVFCTWVCVLEEAMGYPLGPQSLGHEGISQDGRPHLVSQRSHFTGGE